MTRKMMQLQVLNLLALLVQKKKKLSDQGISTMLDDTEDDAQDDAAAAAQFACNTSTKEQILTQMIRKSATYRNPPT
jgi:hypothetical protein